MRTNQVIITSNLQKQNMKAEFDQLCYGLGRLYVDVKVLSPFLHGGHQGEGLLQHPQDHWERIAVGLICLALRGRNATQPVAIT